MIDIFIISIYSYYNMIDIFIISIYSYYNMIEKNNLKNLKKSIDNILKVW